MKEKKLKFCNRILLAGVLIMGSLLICCESSDVEIQDSRVKYEKVLSQIVDKEGWYRFPKNESNDVTVLGCQTENQAEGFVKGLTLGEYKGGEFTTLNMGQYGAVVVKKLAVKDQYFQVEVKLKACDTVRLFLVSESYFGNLITDNGDEDTSEEIQVFVCSNCHTSFAYRPEICPICLDVPILTLLTIPTLSIDQVTVDFDIEVKNNNLAS